MINPLVSIIIPAYNRAHLISETLDSIIAQSYTNWECIIVDDGSSDSTEQVIQKYINIDKRFQFYKRPTEQKKGASACRNYGLKLSRGQYINWFDSDDIMLNFFLKDKIENLQPEMNFIISSGFYVNDRLEKPRKIPMVLDGDLFVDFVSWKSHVYTPSVLFKKSFLVENNYLFSTELTRGEETYMYASIFFKTNKKDYKIIPSYSFKYRIHQNSNTIGDQNKYNVVHEIPKFICYKHNLELSTQLNNRYLISCVLYQFLKVQIDSLGNSNLMFFKTLKIITATLLKFNFFKAISYLFLILFQWVFKPSYKLKKILENHIIKNL